LVVTSVTESSKARRVAGSNAALSPEQHGDRDHQHGEERHLGRQAGLGQARVQQGSGHAGAAGARAPTAHYVPTKGEGPAVSVGSGVAWQRGTVPLRKFGHPGSHSSVRLI